MSDYKSSFDYYIWLRTHEAIEPNTAAILTLASAVEYCGNKIRDLGKGSSATILGAIEELCKTLDKRLSDLYVTIAK